MQYFDVYQNYGYDEKVMYDSVRIQHTDEEVCVICRLYKLDIWAKVFSIHNESGHKVLWQCVYEKHFVYFALKKKSNKIRLCTIRWLGMILQCS